MSRLKYQMNLAHLRIRGMPAMRYVVNLRALGLNIPTLRGNRTIKNEAKEKPRVGNIRFIHQQRGDRQIFFTEPQRPVQARHRPTTFYRPVKIQL